MKVIFTSYAKDEPRIIGTWTLRGGIAVCDNEQLRDMCDDARPINYDLNREVTPADGESYLMALPMNFSGSAVRAELSE